MRWLLVALLLASCATPSQHQPRAAVWTPVTTAPRPEPSRASRDRAPLLVWTAASPAAAAHLGQERRTLSTTCYVATGSRTASGLWPKPGMAAGNRWPLGTRLRVEGIGVVVVQDRIGHGSQLDLFMTSEAACRRFGRQRLAVEVLPAAH